MTTIKAREIRQMGKVALASCDACNVDRCSYYELADGSISYVVRRVWFYKFRHIFTTIELLDNGDIIVWFKEEYYNLSHDAGRLARNLSKDLTFWESVYGVGYYE